MEFKTESEYLAVKQVSEEHPVAWEWFRRLLKESHRTSAAAALVNDGDAGTRAKGAALECGRLYEMLDDVTKAIEGDTYDAE